MVGWLISVWKVCEVYRDVVAVMKSRSKTSGSTAGPDTGLGTMICLTSVLNSLGLEERGA